MNLSMGWTFTLLGAVLVFAQDGPKPQPQPKPMPQPIPRIQQPRSAAAKKLDDVLEVKDKILLKHEEEIFRTSSRPTDLEGNAWLNQFRINFIRAKIQGDDSSLVKGLRVTFHTSPVPFVKGSTKDVRQRTETLGPEETESLIRLLEQLEKAIAQKENGFMSASFRMLGLNFMASYTIAEPVVGIYEVEATVENHPTGTLLHSQAAKTLLKDLLEALRSARQKMQE